MTLRFMLLAADVTVAVACVSEVARFVSSCHSCRALASKRPGYPPPRASSSRAPIPRVEGARGGGGVGSSAHRRDPALPSYCVVRDPRALGDPPFLIARGSGTHVFTAAPPLLGSRGGRVPEGACNTPLLQL